MTNHTHRWRFFRAGGFDQVRLDSAADLAALDKLDQKLWVALSCPTRGLEFDSRTLDLIDSDKDGRIRAPEIIAACKWACALLKDPGQLANGAASLPLDAINDATPDGKRVLESARQILANLGRPQATAISLEDTTDTERIFSETHFNGDGVVPVESADDEATRAVIGQIIDCIGSKPDRSGKPGIDQAAADRFFAEAQAYGDWHAAAEADPAGILPVGQATQDARAALAAVKPKVDDYFARCRLAAFDARALVAMNRPESEYLAIGLKDLTLNAPEVASLPLARVEPGRPLPLTQGINPAWAAAMERLAAVVIRPLVGEREALTEAEWSEVLGRFAAFDQWLAKKPPVAVEKLGVARVRQILAADARQRITGLIEQDKALESAASSIDAVDRLVRYYRDLYRLLSNFVTFRDFYGRGEKAIFQAGTLYLDQRACELCVWVEDAGKHAARAHLSRTYLAYCDVVRRSTAEKRTIVAAFTAGDSDNLMVGRNGVFYDRKGQDWDATIVSVIDNPIGVRQAFWAPYKRVVRLIEDQVAKRAAAANDAAAARVAQSATAAGQAAVTGTPLPEAKPKMDIGVVAALGVAVGGITAALGALLQAFFGLGIWMPLGLVALILLISLPSVIIAWLKLRQRNLGPILDANGWAVNAMAKINMAFGASLTSVGRLPPGSKRDRRDPYGAKTVGATQIAVAAVVVAGALLALWYFGVAEKLAPKVFPQSPWVMSKG